MNNSLIIVWPKGCEKVSLQATESFIGKYAEIFMSKKIPVTKLALKTIVVQVYEGEIWLGGGYNRFKGAEVKTKECWSNIGQVYVFAVKGLPKEIAECKELFRELTGLSNSACHSTDTNEEYVKLLAFFENENSLHFLKHGNIFKYKGLYENIVAYRNIIGDRGDFVIASSTVLELYGLRKSRDIDYLTTDKQFHYSTQNIGNHENCLQYYSKTAKELVENESNYFWIWGVKVISLENLLEFKIKRNEYPKDVRDVAMIKKKLIKST